MGEKEEKLGDVSGGVRVEAPVRPIYDDFEVGNITFDGYLDYQEEMEIHGLRAVASTWANESGKYRPDVVEVALAHKEQDRVRAAYNRAQFIGELRQLWQGAVIDVGIRTVAAARGVPPRTGIDRAISRCVEKAQRGIVRQRPVERHPVGGIGAGLAQRIEIGGIQRRGGAELDHEHFAAGRTGHAGREAAYSHDRLGTFPGASWPGNVG